MKEQGKDKDVVDQMFSKMNSSADIPSLDTAFHEMLNESPQFYDEALKVYKKKQASLLGQVSPDATSTLKKREHKMRGLWLYSFILSMSFSLLFSFFCVEEIYAKEKFDSLLKADEKFKKEMNVYLEKGYSKDQIFNAVYQNEKGKKLLLDPGLFIWLVPMFLVFISVGGWFYLFLYQTFNFKLGNLIGMGMQFLILVMFIFRIMSVKTDLYIIFSFMFVNMIWFSYTVFGVKLKEIRVEARALLSP